MKKYLLLILFVILALSAPQSTFAQWVPAESLPGEIYPTVANGNYAFVGSIYFGVYRSTDNGITWDTSNVGLPLEKFVANTYRATRGLTVSRGNIFACTDGAGVYISTNNGTSWTPVNHGLTDTALWTTAMAAIDSNIFFGTDHGAGVFRSTNNGTSWTSANNGLKTSVYTFAVIGTDIFASLVDTSFAESTNNGQSWTTVNFGHTLSDLPILIKGGSTLFVMPRNERQVWLSTDKGLTWSHLHTSFPDSVHYSFAVSGNNIFISTDSAGVFLSKNLDTTWRAINTGLPSTDVYDLEILGGYLFAWTHTNKVWRRSLSEINNLGVTSHGVLRSLTLSQNYPNPFNPFTTISYEVAERSIVTVEVFDMLGRKIQTLISGAMDAGTHNARFDAGDLTSGVYLARLSVAGSRRQIEMILNK